MARVHNTPGHERYLCSTFRPLQRRAQLEGSQSNPWDALEALDMYSDMPDFANRWRGFLRDCALLLLPALPLQAAEWVTAADDFDAGRLDLDDLTAARARAWQFHDARRDTAPAAELSGLRAVMYRLWPEDEADRWFDSALHFWDFCEDAGLQERQLSQLLRARFDNLGTA